MGHFLHKFSTRAQHMTAYDGETYEEPWVGCDAESDTVTYNKEGIEMSLSALRDATNYCDECCRSIITLDTQGSTLSANRQVIMSDSKFSFIITETVPEGTPAVIENGDLTLDEATFGAKWRLNFSPDITARTPNEPTWPITSVNGNTIANMEKVYVDPGYAMGTIYVTTHYYVTRDGDTYNVSYYDEKDIEALH